MTRFSGVGVATILLVCVFSGCSVQRLIVKKTADALSSDRGGTVFTTDNDPQLVGNALPFALKMYESLLEQAPRHVRLLLSTGKAFCIYAYAFVQSPAEQLPDEQLELRRRELQRAKKLYLRARDYLLRALEVRHPGFNKLMNLNRLDSALALTELSDTALLYWTAASWMGAFSADKFDLSLMMGIPKAVAIMRRASELNDAFGEGAIHEFFISYYGAMPASMGGNEAKARDHFARAVELSHGRKASPYISFATTICVNNQSIDEFRYMLNQALRIDPNATPHHRLANIVAQDKARWLLKHIDRFFLVSEEQRKDSIQ